MTNMKTIIYSLLIPYLPKMHLFHILSDVCGSTSAEMDAHTPMLTGKHSESLLLLRARSPF